MEIPDVAFNIAAGGVTIGTKSLHGEEEHKNQRWPTVSGLEMPACLGLMLRNRVKDMGKLEYLSQYVN